MSHKCSTYILLTTINANDIHVYVHPYMLALRCAVMCKILCN